jgi:hypothetical protein
VPVASVITAAEDKVVFEAEKGRTSGVVEGPISTVHNLEESEREP